MEWYETPDGKKRLELEKERLAEFPQMQLKEFFGKTIVACGQMLVAGGREFTVFAIYPRNYGIQSSRIKVYLPVEPFSKDTPHRNSDGELSLRHVNDDKYDDIRQVLGFTMEWIFMYEIFLQTGEWRD